MRAQSSPIIIDGKFVSERVTGAERYALDLIRGLDEVVGDRDVRLVVPKGAADAIRLNAIRVVSYGFGRGPLWEQLWLPDYVRKEHGVCISLTNTVPLSCPLLIGAILDVRPFLERGFHRGVFSTLRRWYLRLCMRRIADSACRIITISDVCRKQIVKTLHVKRDKIEIVSVPWDHVQKIQPDGAALERRGLKFGDFFFSLSTALPHKNIPWIVEAAAKSPSETFVIAGSVDEKTRSEVNRHSLSNIFLLGYVSDEEAKALMGSCKAFLSPSLYEGFGLPPLEAVASGCRCLILSDIPVYHEVYGNLANYVDPQSCSWRWSDEVKRISDAQADALLSHYRTEASANIMMKLIRSIEN